MSEKKEPFFETQEEFIEWISAYYPAPHNHYEGYGQLVKPEQYKKNVESWKDFFENMEKWDVKEVIYQQCLYEEITGNKPTKEKCGFHCSEETCEYCAETTINDT